MVDGIEGEIGAEGNAAKLNAIRKIRDHPSGVGDSASRRSQSYAAGGESSLKFVTLETGQIKRRRGRQGKHEPKSGTGVIRIERRAIPVRDRPDIDHREPANILATVGVRRKENGKPTMCVHTCDDYVRIVLDLKGNPHGSAERHVFVILQPDLHSRRGKVELSGSLAQKRPLC